VIRTLANQAKKAKKTEAKPKKKRIYEVAREFNLSSVAMVDVINGLGFEVKNHMAVCTDDMVTKVQEKFEEERSAAREEMQRKSDQARQRAEAPAKPKDLLGKSVTEVSELEVVEIPKDQPRGRGRKPPTSRPEPAAKPDPTAQQPPPDGEKGAKRSKRRRRGRPAVDQREVAESVRRTMAQMSTAAPRRRRQRRDDEEGADDELDAGLLKVNEFTTVGELSELMDVKPTEVITKCLQMGVMVTINQRLDMDTIELVADEFGFEVEKLEEFAEDIVEVVEEEAEEDLKPRPPIVTIMGHVDHGKTSLLDYVRKTNVVAGEAGGITQHIGAYHVELPSGRMVTFLDTPGHEAFTAMRARGAQVTDVVVLIVAADDSVMPQTIEAIDHANAAEVPMLVAINKVDLPTAAPDKIKRELSEHGVLVEEFGGQVQSVQISAMTGQNVDGLLDLLALETEILELRANPDRRAKGTIVEARLDRGRGNVATVLVQQGTLKVGDAFVTGLYNGRVRAMLDERGQTVEEAGPSVPVQVLGLDGLPQAGDQFTVLESERETREISQKRQQLRREQDFRKVRRVSLTDIHDQIQAGEMQELRLILKGDVDGSVEALQDSLMAISHEEVKIVVIHRAVGAITESDVLLATASDAIIIGFNVRPDANARAVAEREKVDIRPYRVIYEAVEDVRAALSGMLRPTLEEKVVATVEVREIFSVPRAGTIAGSFVTEGLILRSSQVRLVRDGVVIYDGRVGSLRRFKEDVREVQSGFECGVSIENFNDIKVSDVIEAYEVIEISRTLE
jgi:translation initiation factor IF-2